MKNLEIKIFTPKNGGDYYVYIYDKNSQKILKKFYKEINTYHNDEERLCAAQDMQKALEIKIRAGWLPNIGKSLIQPIDIYTAFSKAIEQIKGKVSKNTFDAYSCTTRFFLKAIQDLHFNKLPSDRFTRAYAKKCLDHVVTERNWSNHAYNKNLGYISSVFSEIIESEQAEINPFRDIKNLKVSRIPANIPPTDKEMALICDHLKAHNYGFYIFYMLIYHCGIRPDEIRLLKVYQLDFERKLIHLEADETKSKKDRSVPMLGNVFELLKYCKNENPDHFVFGTWVPNGGRHSQRNWFSPNQYSIKEDTPNRQWKKLIKEGLGINKSLYSGKHKGADDKREAGIPIKTICEIFGHSETEMTERYMHSLKLERFEEARKVKSKIF